MSRIFTNGDQLKEWVEAAEGIERRFGTEKALGYVIGEKFYNLAASIYESRRSIRTISEERKKTWYNPLRERNCGNSKYIENLDETYEQEKETIIETEVILGEFSDLIKGAFAPHKIRQYFESNPRLGTLGHTVSDEQYYFLISNGSVEHTLDTEIEDALIFGDMLKYF
jgi:hypothetical protein